MTTCSDCEQQRHVIDFTQKKGLPVEVCGCDVARSWILVQPSFTGEWTWLSNPPGDRA